ncbi:MAG: GNAT family N-acetyltransferase [Magnetococcales bacterium]|nr:GNAT family N-acetyltransferase [Magnetococcales bacterium]
MNFSFIKNSQLNDTQRLKVARLVYSAVPEFYKRFGVSITTIAPHIAKLIGKKNTELEHGYTLLSNKSVLGAYNAYPAKELKMRQMFGLLALTKSLDKKLPSFTHELTEPPDDSYYLARIAVDESVLRQGVGEKLLNHFIAETELPLLSLHVHITNKTAIAFYHRHGFITQDPDNQQFYLLTNKR